MAIEKRVREEYEEKINAEIKAKEQVERKLRQANESIGNLSDNELRERARAEKAEQRLIETVPMEKDANHARQLNFLLKDFGALIKKNIRRL